jgi:hypothetical protein
MEPQLHQQKVEIIDKSEALVDLLTPILATEATKPSTREYHETTLVMHHQ